MRWIHGLLGRSFIFLNEALRSLPDGCSGKTKLKNKDKHLWLGLILLLGFLLYFPWLSTRYDLNGLIEAAALERGELFSPHHLLYRPLAWPFYYIFKLYVPAGRSLPVLQWLSACSGTIGLGLYFLILSHTGVSLPTAAGFTLALGLSWSYWVFSTEAAYIIPANTAAIGSLLLTLSKNPPSARRVIMASWMTALAVLLWQVHGILFFIWIAHLASLIKALDRRALRSSLAGLIGAVAITTSVYLGAGAWETRSTHPFRILQWMLSYETRLPIWGHLTLERVPIWFQTAIASWIPLSEGLGWRAMLRGERLDLWGILCALALGISALTLFSRLFHWIRHGSWSPVQAIYWGVGFYALFILWWDPWEPKWFVTPNALLMLLLAHAWSRRPGSRITSWVLIASLGLIGGANLHKSIIPRHQGPHPLQDRARCVAEHMRETDILLATDWTWAEYVAYFHQRSVLSLLDLAARYPDHAVILRYIHQANLEARQRSGHMYMWDPSFYPQDYLRWLKATTGFTPEELEALKGAPAFTCNGLRFFEVQVEVLLPLEPQG